MPVEVFGVAVKVVPLEMSAGSGAGRSCGTGALIYAGGAGSVPLSGSGESRRAACVAGCAGPVSVRGSATWSPAGLKRSSTWPATGSSGSVSAAAGRIIWLVPRLTARPHSSLCLPTAARTLSSRLDQSPSDEDQGTKRWPRGSARAASAAPGSSSGMYSRTTARTPGGRGGSAWTLSGPTGRSVAPLGNAGTRSVGACGAVTGYSGGVSSSGCTASGARPTEAGGDKACSAFGLGACCSACAPDGARGRSVASRSELENSRRSASARERPWPCGCSGRGARGTGWEPGCRRASGGGRSGAAACAAAALVRGLRRGLCFSSPCKVPARAGAACGAREPTIELTPEADMGISSLAAPERADPCCCTAERYAEKSEPCVAYWRWITERCGGDLVECVLEDVRVDRCCARSSCATGLGDSGSGDSTLGASRLDAPRLGSSSARGEAGTGSGSVTRRGAFGTTSLGSCNGRRCALDAFLGVR